ncbi:MAG: phosphoribosyl-ATP diphosphatase [Deferribacteraceae bacterium]|nr:phosphoribosyl-ATP diphosphatase [Deferribacteraceae bacterium]
MGILEVLSQTVRDRAENPVEGSYTNKLLNGGDNLIIKKLGEENAEFMRAFFIGSADELAGEAADYIYHLIVALRYRGVGFEKVEETLFVRHR